MMMRATKTNNDDYVCAALGMAIGICCLILTQSVTKDYMDPIAKSCTENGGGGGGGGTFSSHHEERIAASNNNEGGQLLVAYVPQLGGSFVCIITQFLADLATNYPGGLLTWGGILVVSLPFTVISGIEAGRVGAKGPVRYSVAIGLLAQFLGVCVVMPAIWIPSYILGGSPGGPFHPNRPLHSITLFALPALFTVAIFTLDIHSLQWRMCAGLLGGPLVALYYLTPPPTTIKEMQLNEVAAKAYYRRAFQIAGGLSLIGYVFLAYTAISVYGFSLSKIWNGLWAQAHPAVKFMTIDTIGFYLATVIYTYRQGPYQMVTCVLLTPIVGPGAACSYALLQAANSIVPFYDIPKADDKNE